MKRVSKLVVYGLITAAIASGSESYEAYTEYRLAGLSPRQDSLGSGACGKRVPREELRKIAFRLAHSKFKIHSS